MHNIGPWFEEPIGVGEASSESGENGIEVEVEGKNIPSEPPQYWWNIHQDNSLKIKKPDDQALEFVLKKPLAREKVPKALDFLAKQFEKATIYDSTRTSVHVHLNFQGRSWLQLFNFATMWTTLEPALLGWCREDRRDNLFCLRGTSAEGALDNISFGLREGKTPFCPIYNLDQETYRYAAMNLTSINKFGSVELRCLEGTTDMARIYEWCKILWRLRDASEKYENPAMMMQDLSGTGIGTWCHNILGFSWNSNELWESARLAQDLAYSNTWIVDKTMLVKEKKKSSPFGGTQVTFTSPPFMPASNSTQAYTDWYNGLSTASRLLVDFLPSGHSTPVKKSLVSLAQKLGYEHDHETTAPHRVFDWDAVVNDHPLWRYGDRVIKGEITFTRDKKFGVFFWRVTWN